MKTAHALKYFGSQAALAMAAGVTRQAVSRWMKTGLVPRKAAIRLTNTDPGKIRLGLNDYVRAATEKARASLQSVKGEG